MRREAVRSALIALAALAVACGTVAPDGESGPEARAAGRDLAPETYDLTADALWDGRPSLGGVWVAHAEVSEPLRVLISRPDSPAVEGALFRRERLMPGPPLQVSSEAAAALGLAAGQPEPLRVVALATEADDDDPSGDAAAAGAAEAAESGEPETVEVQRGAASPLGPRPSVAQGGPRPPNPEGH